MHAVRMSPKAAYTVCPQLAALAFADACSVFAACLTGVVKD